MEISKEKKQICRLISVISRWSD